MGYPSTFLDTQQDLAWKWTYYEFSFSKYEHLNFLHRLIVGAENLLELGLPLITFRDSRIVECNDLVTWYEFQTGLSHIPCIISNFLGVGLRDRLYVSDLKWPGLDFLPNAWTLCWTRYAKFCWAVPFIFCPLFLKNWRGVETLHWARIIGLWLDQAKLFYIT